MKSRACFSRQERISNNPICQPSFRHIFDKVGREKFEQDRARIDVPCLQFFWLNSISPIESKKDTFQIQRAFICLRFQRLKNWWKPQSHSYSLRELQDIFVPVNIDTGIKA